MNVQPDQTLYIVDEHCAARLKSLLAQLSIVVGEALERRRFQPAGRYDYGVEEVDLSAAVNNFRQEELDEIF